MASAQANQSKGRDMFGMRRRSFALLSGIAALTPLPAAAQDLPAAADPAVAPAPLATPAGSKRVFTPADFTRFAPRTAYDMLVQVPGFVIRVPTTQERGLGQANENVLVNGERITNKSGGVVAELQRFSAASVQRIEIVDAAQLGIAGLAGEVANVVIESSKRGSGQFEWRPEVRAHYAHANLLDGSVSYTDTAGPVEYTLSLNNGASRGAYGGPIRIFDPTLNLVETREEALSSDFDQPKLTAQFKYDGPGSSLGNLTAAWGPYWYDFESDERRTRTDGDHSTRRTEQVQRGYTFDLNGDYEFALGGGRLKLIGLRHYEHEPTETIQVDRFDSGVPDEGTRFFRDVYIGETIGRAEYRWKGGPNDWQVSFERAFNRLEQRGDLSLLSPDGEFEPVDYPQGSGIVEEVRYEVLGTLSRPLAANLDLQVAGGAEQSKLTRVDGDLGPREFFRPKGSVSLAWRPAKSWEASLKLRRRVGQISFYDFLAQPNLQEDRENAGNPDLVPPQSWEIEGEVGKELGAWGKTRLRVYAHRIDDIVDFIPIGEDEEAIGNLPRATLYGAESISTIQFDPIGWTGAKLNLTLGFEQTSVRDPLTGDKRAISGSRDRWVAAGLRHDIPGTQIAYGVNANHDHYVHQFYLTEVYRSWEGPWWVSAFVEHKDVMGLTVRATVGNLLNARHRTERVVFVGRRNDPIDFYQSHDQLIGPIFSLQVRGNF